MAGARRRHRIDPGAVDLTALRLDDIPELSDEQLRGLAAQLLPRMGEDRQENQLLYYQPNLTSLVMHQSPAHKKLIGGGNRSGKSAQILADVAARATGVVPYSLRNVGIDWSTRLRGPLNCRLVCANLDTVLPKMLAQLQWDQWSGAKPYGGPRGHWGWIPRRCLRDGSWKSSWSEQHKMLTFYYLDEQGEPAGESTFQFMSHFQAAQSMASVDIDELILDEIPPYEVFLESCARVMGVGGYLYLAMTWPDEPTINVDWVFDELYDKGIPGPFKDPGIDYFEIATADNPNVDQEWVAKQDEQYARVSGARADTRMRGKPMRFSNRVHPLFTDKGEDWYCHECGELTHVDHGHCARSRRNSLTNEPYICHSTRVQPLCHMVDFEFNPSWPVVMVIDPHPRKPKMISYFAVRPDDTVMWFAELEEKGDATDIKIACDAIEREFGMHVRRYIGDPRALAAPHGMDKNITWLDKFHAAGLYVEQANSDMDTGIMTVNQMLKPDEYTQRPKLLIHPRCRGARLQMSRFMWDDWKAGSDKDQKQQTKKKYDDYPAMVRYFANGDFTFHNLMHGMSPVLAINMRRPDRERYMERRQRYTAPRGYVVQ